MEVIYGLLNSTISDDFEWHSRSSTYCKAFKMLFFVQLCKIVRYQLIQRIERALCNGRASCNYIDWMSLLDGADKIEGDVRTREFVYSIFIQLSILTCSTCIRDYPQHCAQRNAPVFKLLRGRFWVFSTPQGRRVAPIGVKFGTQEGMPHFTPIGATVRV